MNTLPEEFISLIALEQVTIAPRAGRELGYVRMKMDHMRFREGLLRCVLLKTLFLQDLEVLKRCIMHFEEVRIFTYSDRECTGLFKILVYFYCFPLLTLSVVE